MRPGVSIRLVASLVAATAAGCNKIPTIPTSSEVCSGYPDWQVSTYVLPYDVGRSHRISQGNCTTASHQGTLRYSYDMQMPFGSVVRAARDGVVTALRVSQPAGSRGLTASNYLQIRHVDGVFSDYVHLAQGGNLVGLGDVVRAGDPVAITGDTGDIGNSPHLHFNITTCGDNLRCDTLPVTFRNTAANPEGLKYNVFYEALAYPR